MEFFSSFFVLLLVVGTNEKAISDGTDTQYAVKSKRSDASQEAESSLLQLNNVSPISDKTSATKEQSSKDETKNNVSPSTENVDASEGTEDNVSHHIPSYIRIIPAAIMVLIFLVGLGAIFFYQKLSDKRQLRRDIKAFDDETANTWMEHLRSVQRRPSMIDKVKASTEKDRVVEERHRKDIDEKYMLYDSMLAKYRASLAHTVKQKRAAQGSQASFASGKSLKDLAERHRQLSHKSDTSSEDMKPSLSNAMLKKKLIAMKEREEKSSFEDDPGITFLPKTKRKPEVSETKKELLHGDSGLSSDNEPVRTDQETQDSWETRCRILARRNSLQKQCKVNLDDKAAAFPVQNHELLHDIGTSVSTASTVDEPAEDQYEQPQQNDNSPHLQVEINIHPPSRPPTPEPRSILTLPATNDDDVFTQPTVMLSTESVPLLTAQDHELLHGIGNSISTTSTLRTNAMKRERPKSLFANLTNFTNIKKKSPKKRPMSLLVKSSISDEDPELGDIDFEALHQLQFKHKSETHIAKIVSSVERKMIADIYHSSQDLNNDEVKALELLLDDVSKYSGDDRRGSTRWLEARQYSLGSDRSVSPVHLSSDRMMDMNYMEERRTPSPRLLTTPLSFADSESIFTSLDEEDEDEEQVLLMSIMGDSNLGTSTKGNGTRGGGTLSTYDNL